MSSKAVIQITCDDCGEKFDGSTFSVRGVRGEAHRAGWEVNVIPTQERPAQSDDFADFCPNCKGGERVTGEGKP